jgi:pimeloyl-ACP methyl ester carboxylesterase
MILSGTDQGEGPGIVLLHGLFGQSRNLGALARPLVADGRRVLSLDLRNHGGSPHADAMDYPVMADDVVETMDAHGIAMGAILGHSMGGKVAMRLALGRPDRVERLIVADIAPVPNPPNFGPLAVVMATIDPATMTRAEADRALSEAASDPSVRAFLLQNARFGAGGGWRIGLSEIRAALPRIEGWDAPFGARYTGPTMFIRGARSGYVRDADIPAIRATFPAAEIVTITDAGHWLHADKPDAVAAAVLAFLRSAR